MTKHVTFDGLSLPIEGGMVSLDTTDEDSRLAGAGITWAEIDGKEAITVELAIHGLDPMHFSVVELDDGSYELVLPDVQVIQPT